MPSIITVVDDGPQFDRVAGNCGKTHALGSGMPLNHPHVIDQWIRNIRRGHDLSVHPGHDTIPEVDDIRRSAIVVRSARAWENANLDYDSTLGFAERAGFRCGVCFEFPLYDVQEQKAFNVRERPLIIMDTTVVKPRYMNLGVSPEAFNYMRDLKIQCRRFNGDFTILWHNDRFRHEIDRDFYSQVLSA